MKCPRCQHENSSALKFCGECGARLVAVCASCGVPNPPDQKFCGECGAKFTADAAPSGFVSPHSYTPQHLAQRILTSRAALEGERKQVTVLFCDIANSTQLAEQAGAEAMHGILSRFFELALEQVHRYEGTVNQFLGDGFMALFGAPIAHEDDARRAVLAALSLRGALGEQQARLGLPGDITLQVRIGLHTGLVVVGSIGDNLRMDYTAIGDTTHLAARLEQAAVPGQILMSDSTARLVRGYVTSHPLPPLTVKGKSEAVNAFEVIALGSRRSRLHDDRALSPFVGRERELSILREALDEGGAGHGQVVGIVGEPGVGKSRLLYEFRRLLHERNVAYLEGWCLSYGQSIPYLPLQDVLRASCGIAPSDTPAQIGEHVRQALTHNGLSAETLAPYLLQALGVKEGAQSLVQISPETIQARTLDALQQFALAQSKRGTLVLAIEDLHWIDKTSEEFLVRLIESLAGARILLITTTRPGYSAPWLGKSYATQLPLRVLANEAARRIVEATVERTELADAATESILRKAEGNPLFLEELTLALLEHQHIDADTTLPDTIQGVLAARIDRLPESAKRTLQTASVLGREFSLRVLEEVSEHPSDLADQLAVLKQLEFVYERTEADGPVYIFKHALTQEVAYESLLSARRQALHESAGRAIEALYPNRLEEHYELLAHHFARSTNKEKALDYLDLANRKAIKANAVIDAKDYFEQANQVLDKLPHTAENRHRRIELVVRNIHVFILNNSADEYERYLERFASIAETLSDQGLRGHFQSCLGHCQFGLSRPLQAIRTLGPAAALCEQAGNYEGAGHAYAHLQWSHLMTGDFEDVLSLEASALSALARAPNLRLRLYALSASTWACARLARWDLGIEKAMAALAECEQAADPSLISLACWSLSLPYIYRGSAEEAIHWSRRGFETAPTLNDRSWSQLFCGWALIPRAPVEAVALLAPLIPLWLGRWQADAIALVALGEAYFRAGQLEQAHATLEQAIDVSQPSGSLYMVAPAQRLLGEVLLAKNRFEESEEWFKQAIELLQRLKAENEVALAQAGYGRLLAKQGRRSEGRALLSQALVAFEALGTIGEPERVRAEVAAL